MCHQFVCHRVRTPKAPWCSLHVCQTRSKDDGHEKSTKQRCSESWGIRKSTSSDGINEAAGVTQENEGSDCVHYEILSRCCWRRRWGVAMCNTTSRCWRRRSRRQNNSYPADHLLWLCVTICLANQMEPIMTPARKQYNYVFLIWWP